MSDAASHDGLDAVIEELTVDCNGEDRRVAGAKAA